MSSFEALFAEDIDFIKRCDVDVRGLQVSRISGSRHIAGLQSRINDLVQIVVWRAKVCKARRKTNIACRGRSCPDCEMTVDLLLGQVVERLFRHGDAFADIGDRILRILLVF